MTTKKYNFVQAKDVYGYFFIFGVIPYFFTRWVIRPSLEPFDPVTIVSYPIFLTLYFICYFYFHPKLAGITEIRGEEIRFFNPFSTRWAPIDHFRYIAKDSDPDHVMVYKRNCKKIGRIPLKSAGPEEKREFLAHIEPWLVQRKEDVSQKIDVEK